MLVCMLAVSNSLTLGGPQELGECWSHFSAGGEAVLAFGGGSACFIAQLQGPLIKLYVQSQNFIAEFTQIQDWDFFQGKDFI